MDPSKTCPNLNESLIFNHQSDLYVPPAKRDSFKINRHFDHFQPILTNDGLYPLHSLPSYQYAYYYPFPTQTPPFISQRRMKDGRVKWFNPRRGFGYIVVDQPPEEVYVHAVDIEKVPQVLTEGECVRFYIVKDENGPSRKAVNVRPLFDFNQNYYYASIPTQQTTQLPFSKALQIIDPKTQKQIRIQTEKNATKKAAKKFINRSNHLSAEASNLKSVKATKNIYSAEELLQMRPVSIATGAKEPTHFFLQKETNVKSSIKNKAFLAKGESVVFDTENEQNSEKNVQWEMKTVNEENGANIKNKFLPIEKMKEFEKAYLFFCEQWLKLKQNQTAKGDSENAKGESSFLKEYAAELGESIPKLALAASVLAMVGSYYK